MHDSTVTQHARAYTYYVTYPSLDCPSNKAADFYTIKFFKHLQRKIVVKFLPKGQKFAMDHSKEGPVMFRNVRKSS